MDTRRKNEALSDIEKKEAGRMEIPSELKKSLEALNEKGKCCKETMPNIPAAASSMECTGLMCAAPKNAEEYASYQDLYSMEIPPDAP